MNKSVNIIINGENCGNKDWYVCTSNFFVNSCESNQKVEIQQGDFYCLMYSTPDHVSLTKDFVHELVIMHSLFQKHFSKDVDRASRD